MSVSSVALSSLAASPPVAAATQVSHADSKPTDMPIRPAASSPTDQQPVKAAVQRPVGQVIDINA